jgi:hypothetical protein
MSTETSTATRRYRRISLPQGMLVAWYGGGEQRVSRVKTIGMGGLFVAEPNAPRVGTDLRLSFAVLGGSVHMEAVVRSVTPGQGMGIEFVKLNTRDRVLMEMLLRRLLREIPE